MAAQRCAVACLLLASLAAGRLIEKIVIGSRRHRHQSALLIDHRLAGAAIERILALFALWRFDQIALIVDQRIIIRIRQQRLVVRFDLPTGQLEFGIELFDRA